MFSGAGVRHAHLSKGVAKKLNHDVLMTYQQWADKEIRKYTRWIEDPGCMEQMARINGKPAFATVARLINFNVSAAMLHM